MICHYELCRSNVLQYLRFIIIYLYLELCMYIIAANLLLAHSLHLLQYLNIKHRYVSSAPAIAESAHAQLLNRKRSSKQ